MHAYLSAPVRPKSVVIIDDHDIVRFGLETVIRSCAELHLIDSAGTLAEGLKLIASTKPDLVISDMGTRDSSGLDTIRAVVAAQAPRAVLVVSVHDEMLYGEQAISLGASGYVMKESAHAHVIPAALTVLQGGTWVSPRLSARLVNRMLKSPRGLCVGVPDTALSSRELQVLELLKSGKSTKEIASIMDVSVRTIDIHRARIKRKLGLRTGAQLIAFASSQF